MRNPHERFPDKWRKIKKKVLGFFDWLIPNRLQSWLEGIVLIVVAIAVAYASYRIVGYLIDHAVKNDVLKTFAEAISGYIEAAVAAISAGFVVLQLKSGTKQEMHQADVEEAQFILEYNKSFTENKQLTEIERYLECKLTGADFGEIKNLESCRQDMVNYLVYLEGLASCIHSGVLRFDRIDDLLAYRFFIAMNHIEPQAIDLFPYAAYYRGCFRLYEEWMAYRITSNKYTEEEDWEIPLFSTALCNHYGYEKYANPKMKLTVTAGNNDKELVFKAWIPRKGLVKLYLTENRVKIWHTPGIRMYKGSPMYRALLRRILKEIAYAGEHKNKLFKGIIQFEKITKDQRVEKLLQKQVKDFCAETITGDADAEKMFAAIKYTKAMLIARAQSKRGELQFHQWKNNEHIDERKMKAIADLIYDTDEYIYPDMLGNKQIAEEVLPKLFENGKDIMFRKENLFTCESDGHIMGIILWCEGTLDWSNAPLKAVISAYFKKHIEEEDPTYSDLMETLAQVSKEYMKKYSLEKPADVRPDPADITILNICTNPDARGMRIASAMLQEFLGKHEGKSIELCVLSKNSSAIKLYTKNGFKQFGNEEDAYPQKKKHKRLVMRKMKEGQNENAPLPPKISNQFRCCRRKARTGGIR